MAILRTFVSDFTNKAITGDSAKVSVTIGEDVWVADAGIADAIVTEIKKAGKKQNKRGRKAKTA